MEHVLFVRNGSQQPEPELRAKNRLNSGKTQDSFLEFPEHDLVQALEHDLVQALVGLCFLVKGSKAITSQQEEENIH